MASNSSSSGETGITFYTTQTPNPIKISILLEELKIPYNVHKIDFFERTQKEPWYLNINPNGKVPCLTDIFEDGKEINLWESGSILKYLVERYDTKHQFWYPPGTRENYELFNWGQVTHFTRHAPEKIPYAIDRYHNEVRRLYLVLETRLASCSSGFLVGDKLTIADIANWCLVAAAGWAGIDLNELPYVKDWYGKLLARPALQRGMDVPEPHPVRALMVNPELEQDFVEYSRTWVMHGMAEDAKAVHTSRPHA